jgi:hypothetical protein
MAAHTGWRVNKRFYSIFLTEGPHQMR